METTTNYNLNKPELTDVADITTLSANMDVIDGLFKSHDDSITNHQAALDALKGVGDASTPVYLDTEGKANVTKSFSDYLPLAGGKLTGTLYSSAANTISMTTNDSYMVFRQYSINGGGRLVLYGADYGGTNAGSFYLACGDGESVGAGLQGKPDGTLLWNGSIDANNNSIQLITSEWFCNKLPNVGNAYQPCYIDANHNAIACTMADSKITRGLAQIVATTANTAISATATDFPYVQVNGMLIHWGYATATTSRTGTVTFTRAYANVPSVAITPDEFNNYDTCVSITAVSKTGFSYAYEDAAVSGKVSWIAIGFHN